MKNGLIAIAMIGAVAAAHSQTTTGYTNTIYGTLDVDVAFPDTGNGRHTQVGSGGMTSSSLGFKGDRDLGDGVKAVYNIEAGLLLDTGVVGNSTAGTTGINNVTPSSGGQLGTGTQFFSRQAYAGLSNDMGTLTIGRQYAGSYMNLAVYGNVMGAGFYGGAPTLLALSGGMPTRVNNSIVYKTPTYSGMYGQLLYTTGSENNVGIPTASGTSTLTSASGSGVDLFLSYVSGNLGAGLSTWSLNTATYAPGETGLATKQGALLSVNYDFGLAKVYASAISGTINGGNYENVTKTMSSSNGYHLGMMVPVGKNKFYAGYTSLTDNSQLGLSASVYGVSWSRALDKSTSIYASYGSLQNTANSSYSLTDGGNLVGGVSSPGFNPSSFMVGVNINF